MLPNPSTGVVSLSFGKSQTCRFEKGGFCKKARGLGNVRMYAHLQVEEAARFMVLVAALA